MNRPCWLLLTALLFGVMLPHNVLALLPTKAAGRPEIVLQAGHGTVVMWVGFTPDGRTLISAGLDHTAKQWDLQTGEVRRSLPVEGGDATALSPDGKLVADGMYTGSVTVTERATGTIVQRLAGHTRTVRTTAFSPDGVLLATGSEDARVILWNVTTGERLRTLPPFDSSVFRVTFSPDGKYLATCHGQGKVRLWHVADGSLQRELTGPEKFVGGLNFSPDGRLLAAASFDGNTYVWKVDTGELLHRLSPSTHSAAAFSPDGLSLATVSSGAINLWNAKTGVMERAFPTGGTLRSLAFSADGSLLAGGDGLGNLQLWNAATGEVVRKFAGQGNGVWDITISPDGHTLLCGTNDGSLQLWNRTTGSLDRYWKAHTGTIHAVVSSPDGLTAASCGRDRDVCLWSIANGTLIRKFTGHRSEPYALAFSSDGGLLATGSGSFVGSPDTHEIKLWNPHTGELIRTIPAHRVNKLAFSPDGQWLASSSPDSLLKLYSAKTGELKYTLPSIRGQVAFSHDSLRLAVIASTELQIVETATGRPSQVLPLAGRSLSRLQFSEDSKTLFCLDSRAGAWTVDLAAGQFHQALAPLDTLVQSSAWTPDHSQVVGGGLDGSLRLRRIKDGSTLTMVALNAEPLGQVGTNWLTVSEAGYYDGSPGAARFIKWRVGSDLYPVEAYERTFRRPDLVRRILSGEVLPEDAPRQRFLAGESIPPEVYILTPRAGEITGDETVVEVLVTDDQKIEQVHLQINGRLVNARAVPSDARPIVAGAKPLVAGAKPLVAGAKPIPQEHQIQQTFKATVALPSGEPVLVLRAFAYDDQGLQGWNEVRLVRKEAKGGQGDLYLLAVGVSQYNVPKFNLKYAAVDAEAFTRLWPNVEGKLYRKVIARQLLDQEATVSNIRKSLTALLETVTEQDTVALFVSGHGIQAGQGDFFFGTHEVDPVRPEETALPWSVLERTLAKLEARRVVLFLDACHSGSVLGDKQANNERLAELLARRAGVMVFASCRGQEFSYEREALKHGAFTAALIEGLGEGKADLDIGGRDGTITVQELQAYLAARVPQMTEGSQTPTCPLIRDFGEPFPLLRR